MSCVGVVTSTTERQPYRFASCPANSASPTYRHWDSFELRDDEQVTLYVPAGCAHGFQALTDPADVSYMIDRAHDPAEDVSIAFDDPELAIPWPLPVSTMSQRDRLAPPLAAATRMLA